MRKPRKNYRGNVFLLILSLLLISCSVKGQNEIECLQGIWRGTTMDIEPFEDISNLYQIIQNDSIFSFYLDSDEIIQSIYKFVDFDPELIKTDFYEVESSHILKSGTIPNKEYYYFEIDEDRNQAVDKYYSCNGNELILLHFVYERQSFVPYSVYNFLKKRDNDYLNRLGILFQIKKAKVKTDRTYFHNKPSADAKRRAFVVKDDVVIIDEIQPGWVRVAYEGKKTTTEGWVERADLDMLK